MRTTLKAGLLGFLFVILLFGTKGIGQEQNTAAGDSTQNITVKDDSESFLEAELNRISNELTLSAEQRPMMKEVLGIFYNGPAEPTEESTQALISGIDARLRTFLTCEQSDKLAITK